MDRRDFVRYFAMAGVAGVTLKLTGCGQEPELGKASSVAGDTTTVLVYDLIMEGWSTLGSGYLGDNGTLAKESIRDFKPLTLVYVQDPHGHKFALSEEDFAKILKGQEVRILTTYALDHRHEVRIKSSRRVRGSQPIEVVIDENGRPVQAT